MVILVVIGGLLCSRILCMVVMYLRVWFVNLFFGLCSCERLVVEYLVDECVEG